MKGRGLAESLVKDDPQKGGKESEEGNKLAEGVCHVSNHGALHSPPCTSSASMNVISTCPAPHSPLSTLETEKGRGNLVLALDTWQSQDASQTPTPTEQPSGAQSALPIGEAGRHAVAISSLADHVSERTGPSPEIGHNGLLCTALFAPALHFHALDVSSKAPSLVAVEHERKNASEDILRRESESVPESIPETAILFPSPSKTR